MITINKIFVPISSSTYAPDSSVTLGGNPRADSTKQHPGRACTGRRRAWKRSQYGRFIVSRYDFHHQMFFVLFLFFFNFFARFYKCLICFPCVCRACRVLWVSFHTKTASVFSKEIFQKQQTRLQCGKQKGGNLDAKEEKRADRVVARSVSVITGELNWTIFAQIIKN